MHFLWYGAKLPNLKLKTQPKQLLGSLPLDIAFPPFLYLSVNGVAKINALEPDRAEPACQ